MLAMLAAGQSRRFGEQDKLSAMLGDKMLGLHAAETAARLPFAAKLVVSSPDHDCVPHWCARGYQVILNEDAARGQATSVRLAAAHAIESGASGLCVMLADMPFVTSDHLCRLIAAFEQSGGKGTVTSTRNGQPMPPAIFPSAKLETLMNLAGDSGARKLIAGAEPVAADDPILLDIDTEAELEHANIIINIR